MAGVGVVVLAVVTSLVVVNRTEATANGKYSAANQPLRVFASVTPHAEILNYVNQNLTGGKFTLKVIQETNGVDGNDVVESGDADASYFQRVPDLKADCEDKGYTDLTVAATVHIEPYGIYSSKYQSFSAVPDGSLVLLSNNVSNFARGLYLLQSAGLIKVSHQFGDTSSSALTITERDIVSNPKHLKFKQVDPVQIPRSLPDAALGLINGNVALEAGLSPSQDALLLEKATNNPYANILVVLAELTNDARVTALAAVLSGPKVAADINQQYHGSVLPFSSATS